MTSDIPNPLRPATVSSMSSLDSSASVTNNALEKIVAGDGSTPTADNIVSSSTLDSIGASGEATELLNIPNSIEDVPSSVGTSEMVLSAPPVPIMPSTAPAQAPPAPNNNTVAEFLFQLTKMLTDDNKDVIEWANGQINVHDPYKLASDVLHKYFRHSKFASFQRQLNYFGFRKLAGKGKMAPCSYVNEAATGDIRSLLLIKRKTGGTPKEKGSRKRGRSDSRGNGASSSSATTPVNPVLAGILERNTGSKRHKGGVALTSPAVAQAAVGKGVKHQLNGFLKHPGTLSSTSSQQELAQAAVGRGVRHGLLATPGQADSATAALSLTSAFTFPDPPQLGFPDLQSSLSELTNNYRNSLQSASNTAPAEAAAPETNEQGSAPQQNADPAFAMYGFLSRDSSLVDLAMLVPVEAEEPHPATEVDDSAAASMPSMDFPSQGSESQE